MSLTGYMKMPAGNDKGIAEQEFELQKEKIRQNDITGEYLELAHAYLDEFLHILRHSPDRTLTDEREPLLRQLLDIITREITESSGLFRIHGFRAFIKHPRHDYILAHMDLNGGVDGLHSAELYLGLEVLNRVAREREEKGDKHADELLRKWLLHELICPIFGHTDATALIEEFYPTGKLERLLLNVLERRSSRTETIQVAHRRFSFKAFDLTLEEQKETFISALVMSQIKKRLQTNWFFMAPKSIRQNGRIQLLPKREIEIRIRTVCDQLGYLLQAAGILNEEGNPKCPFRLFISGSYFWCGEFIEDLDSQVEVDLIYDGDHVYSTKRLKGWTARQFLGLGEKSKTPVSLIVHQFGTEQLERAAVGSVKGRDVLRRKVVLLPHEAIQLMGKPLECRPRNSWGVTNVHFENLAKLSACWREDVASGNLSPQEADWFELRVKAVEAYCRGPALEERARDARAAEQKKNSAFAKLARFGFSLASRVAGKTLKALIPNYIDENEANDQDIDAPQRLLISQEFGTLSTRPTNEIPSTSDSSAESMIAEHQQSMISFYGIVLNSGDVLTGYQGRYRLLKKLGEGAQGGVWASTVLDEHDTGIREVAVKIPNRHAEWDLNQDAEWRAAVGFNKEIEALSRLVWHPNIIRQEDWFQEGGDVPFYVMEAVSGTNLFEYFDNRDFCEKDIFGMFCRLAEGLEALHGEGLAHRDLKPENIMIRDSDGQPVILDFGTASDMEELSHSSEPTDAGDAKGTPVYMAPEMAARLAEKVGSHLLIGKDSPFHPNGSTRQFHQEDIIHRIDCAEDGYDQDGVQLSISHPRVFSRVRMRIAMYRVKPVLCRLHESGAIPDLPGYKSCRIIECDAITFGAYCHGDILYVERPYIKNKPFESILMGQPELEFRQDIFALGIMMYQRLTWPKRPTAGGVMTGQLPFVLPEDRSDLLGAVLARLEQKYRPLSYWHRKKSEQFWPVSPSTEAVVMRALSVNPAERYSAKELHHELKQIAEAPDSELEAHSEQYRRNLVNAQLRRVYLWLTSTAILASAGAFMMMTFSVDVPDYLLPKSDKAWLLEGITNIGVIAVSSFLATIAGIAFLLGLVLIFRHRAVGFVELQREIVKRAA